MVRLAQVPATVAVVAATAVTAAEPATLRARRRLRARRDESTDCSKVSSGRGASASLMSITSAGAGRGTAPASRPLARATASAAATTRAAPPAMPSITLAYPPSPASNLRNRGRVASGTSRLPTPMARLARVSSRS